MRDKEGRDEVIRVNRAKIIWSEANDWLLPGHQQAWHCHIRENRCRVRSPLKCK